VVSLASGVEYVWGFAKAMGAVRRESA